MVEKQIEFSSFKTSTIELDCGCSRKLKFTTRKEFFMNKNTHNTRSNKTAPANTELTVATMVDIFYLKEEVDQAYDKHVRTLEVVFTTYREPENGMLISDDIIPYVVRLIESRGYELFKDETLIGRSNRRIFRLSFSACVGMFPNWARPAKEDD